LTGSSILTVPEQSLVDTEYLTGHKVARFFGDLLVIFIFIRARPKNGSIFFLSFFYQFAEHEARKRQQQTTPKTQPNINSSRES